MIDNCKTCIHKRVCGLKKYVEDCCADYYHEKFSYKTKHSLYDEVYIIDRFDTVNNCSLYGDGSGSKSIVNKARRCFITQISIIDSAGNCLYYVQPYDLTDIERNDEKHAFYWEQSFFADKIYLTKADALKSLS
jgi:hypothetical protein